MKHLLFVVFFTLCLPTLFSQKGLSYHSVYEQEILLNKNATHLELLMAMGNNASEERTKHVKKELDAFISEIKSSNLLRLSEVKLMKELHKKVHDRFLTRYRYVSPFHAIFESGQYNCVSATALFALILEELDIPYSIQEQPTHVYIMAYPDTKAISLEMTALKNAYYLPSRKDVSKAVKILLDLGLATPQKVLQQGEIQVYNEFYNTNSVVDLKQLAGIQYLNEAITAANENQFEEALSTIYKTEKLYNVEKTKVFKTELLMTLIADAKFDCMKDITYLVDYANLNLKKTDQMKIYYQYAQFVHEQLISKRNRALADSCQVYISQNLADTALLTKFNGVYYFGLSDFFSDSYNLTKQLEYAELAYKTTPDLSGIQLWLTRSILQSLDKYAGEELLIKLDTYAERYPFLKTHNLFLMISFYGYVEVSNKFYADNDGEKGKKYFDLALKTRETMEDKEVLEQEQIGWLYAEAGSYLYRENDYKAALKMLEEGLKLAPGHERLLARIEIVKSKLK